ncbi:hypothetical protein B0H13DRAFT_1887890 [Mycena leptocephala]|nr:hypothetical protein B0H13DRAFT_1887890 [Mycena leptocephala]
MSYSLGEVLHSVTPIHSRLSHSPRYPFLLQPHTSGSGLAFDESTSECKQSLVREILPRKYVRRWKIMREAGVGSLLHYGFRALENNERSRGRVGSLLRDGLQALERRDELRKYSPSRVRQRLGVASLKDEDAVNKKILLRLYQKRTKFLYQFASSGAAGGEDQERGTIRGVVDSRVRVTRAACGSCRFSRAAQRVVILWGGELTWSSM